MQSERGRVKRGRIREIYSTIQGEGLFIGERQIFVRFLGCNLSCLFCDTVASRVKKSTCWIEKTPGLRDFYWKNNPLSLEDILEAINKLGKFSGFHHSISLTGGEPLLQADFLRDLTEKLKERGFRIYLETNGTLVRSLKKVIDNLDIIAMDWKLPSSTGLRSFKKEHFHFLRLAYEYKKEVFVKTVITYQSLPKEVEEMVSLVREIDSRIPLVLQPVTPAGRVRARVPIFLLHRLQEEAKQKLELVRVIPQTQKLLGEA